MDRYRDVIIKVIVEDMEHCSTDCPYLEGDGIGALCIFGSLSIDTYTGLFKRHCECCISER